MPIASFVPLIVVVPLAVAAAMLPVRERLPRFIPDVIAVVVALGVFALGALLAVHTLRHGPIAYWFGGWRPGPKVVLGIAFGVDPVSAALASFIGLLVAASLVFVWGYFEDVKAHFHVLMLLFLAAMVGFCLTRDLFDLFVWFEVMSVVAFALTGYQLEAPSLSGALNFTVTNSLASFLMLAGVALIYARTGLLDFGALGPAVDGLGRDPVATGAFCLLAAALMTKGAILPFHFWLSDAHAVAPSPVSVLFSGAMVSLGLFVLAKLGLQVFAGYGDARFLMRTLFAPMGCATAVVGGLMAWRQRHLKRLLAFSTIAHLGIMLSGLASLTAAGVAGVAVYFVGHGLVKGALFMTVGMLLATRASLDELDLKGLGRGLWPVALAMGLGGLLLAGLPWGVLDHGTRLAEAGGGPLARAAILAGAGLTGGAVLRATGRIFLGLGPDPGDLADAPSQEDQEKADRPLWLMMAPCGLLLALALAPAHLAATQIDRAAAMLAGPARPLAGPSAAAGPLLPWISTALALGLAAFSLFRQHLPQPVCAAAEAVTRPLIAPVRRVHDGLVGDYVLWMVVGLAAFASAFAFRAG